MDIEQRIHDLIDGAGEMLSNSKFLVSIELKKSSTGHYIRYKIQYRNPKRLLLWCVVKISDVSDLVTAEATFYFVEEKVVNLSLNYQPW